MAKAKDSSAALAWRRFKQSLSETEPKDLVNFVVISTCVLLVYVQVMDCYDKLESPPLITHTALQLNETMTYPALTVCREPPFNKRFYRKYNFNDLHLGSFPLTSQWDNFPFGTYKVADFFREAVYNESVFLAYDLNMATRVRTIPTAGNGSKVVIYSPAMILDSVREGRALNVARTSSIHMTAGLCHTFVPLNTTKEVGKDYGYSFALIHDHFAYDSLRDNDPGWHFYVHEPQEKFSENTNLLSCRQDHVFARAGEEIEINLDVTQFSLLRNCTNDMNYSNTACEEKCWVDWVHRGMNCTAIWFPEMQLPYCDDKINFTNVQRKSLWFEFFKCCKPRCDRKNYRASIVSRLNYPNDRANLTMVYVYFTSKAFLYMEEKYGYDWNAFVADLGGSVGFLLGLSVLGIVGVFEYIVRLIFGQTNKSKKEPRLESMAYPNQKLRLDPNTNIILPTLVAKFDRH